MTNTDNLFKLPVYEEPIYIVVAVSDKSDIEKEINKYLDLDLESIKSHVDYVYLENDRYFFIKVLKDKSETDNSSPAHLLQSCSDVFDNPFLVRLVQSGSAILTCQYKIYTNITSDKFEITEDKDTRTYSFRINNSENVFTILDKKVITVKDYANVLSEFSNGIDDGFIERIIAKGNYSDDDVAKSTILDIYDLVQNKIPDVIKNNIEIKPSINISLSL